MTVEGEFPLNPAQLRNLRNWAAEELANRTITVVVVPALPVGLDVARVAVAKLVQRHRALRSRLVKDADGGLLQRVMSTADLELTENDEPLAHTPEQADPAERALRGVVYHRGGRVVAVKLSLSQVFTDAFGAHAVVGELRRLLTGEPLPAVPRQAGEPTADATAVRRDTGYWKELLAATPRSVTYSGVARTEHEKAHRVRVRLDTEDDELIGEAVRRLRVTRYVLWATAISALVDRVSGQRRQVFRSTYANRFTAEDFRVVDQLAQAVFVPIRGAESDSLRTRAERIAAISLPTYRRGHYDANELLRWLNEPGRSRGAMFQPAFELNYVPPHRPTRAATLPHCRPAASWSTSASTRGWPRPTSPSRSRMSLARSYTSMPGGRSAISRTRPPSRQTSSRCSGCCAGPRTHRSPSCPSNRSPPSPGCTPVTTAEHSSTWTRRGSSCCRPPASRRASCDPPVPG